MINFNLNERPTSLQVSRLWQLGGGDYEVYSGGKPVLIKNITEDTIKLDILLKDSSDYINTTIYPGWNPELVIGIKGVPEDTIQVGN